MIVETMQNVERVEDWQLEAPRENIHHSHINYPMNDHGPLQWEAINTDLINFSNVVVNGDEHHVGSLSTLHNVSLE